MSTKEQLSLERILKSDNLIESINDELNVLSQIIPEICTMFGFEHKHPHHHLNVWEHTLFAMSQAPNNFDIRLALLMHDIGKPICYQTDGGVRHFKGHPEISAQITKLALKRIGFNKDYIHLICTAIKHHDTALTDTIITNNPTLANLIFEIQKCDALAHNPKFNKKRLQYLEDTAKLFNRLQVPQIYTQELGLQDNFNEII